MASKGRRSPRGVLIAVTVVSSLVGVALFEVGARMLGLSYNLSPNWEYHSVLGWSQVPGAAYDIVVEENPVRVSFNTAGFRDSEHAIVKPSGEPGIISCQLGADGQYKDLLYYPVGAGLDLAKAGVGDSRIIMKGNEVFKVAVKTLRSVATQALEKNGVDKSELDWLIPHQANMRIIQATAKRLDLPTSKSRRSTGTPWSNGRHSNWYGLTTASRNRACANGYSSW